jgi:hypothetical protein
MRRVVSITNSSELSEFKWQGPSISSRQEAGVTQQATHQAIGTQREKARIQQLSGPNGSQGRRKKGEPTTQR